MKTLQLQDAIDILTGCTLLGTGGGGRLSDGIKMIEADFKQGKPLKLISLDEIPDDGMIATPYGCGAPPEEGATQFGESIVIPEVVDDLRAEDIVRSIAVVSGDLVGVADHPMRGRDFKSSVIPNAISQAWEIGTTIRQAQETGETQIPSLLANQFNGKIAFHGEMTETPWSCTGGFNIGEIHLKGVEEFQGESYRIWMKNENIVGYRNGIVDASVPDLLCMIDHEGNPLTNPDWVIGNTITLLVLPAPTIWTTPRGLELLGPHSFGLDFDYTLCSLHGHNR
ncbi:MAG: DUF917 domain-containing protein [Eubacteriales bacterium]